mmetsp:Transcript_21796/g.88770  ORF Transcript_21796/g.88770 Transcript_21796/m.88770 type:complete len:454 (-) Transcript_21796:683-2044(-)
MLTTVANNAVVYSVFVRQHSAEGTFDGVTSDFSRIAALGATHVWLLPIHPIGVKNRKHSEASLGCPYAIQDYRAVNPEYGSLEDFQRLIKTAHENDLKVLIDCVYNHTSPDSVLVKNHPDWFHKNDKGEIATRFSEWWDVVDLAYYKDGGQRNEPLWEYLLESLIYWISLGVDGFRCDVASVVPIDFWIEAREAIRSKFPERSTMWLAESTGPSMIRSCRRMGIPMASEAQLHQAFELCYQYNIFKVAQRCSKGLEEAATLLDVLRLEEASEQPEFVKLRFVDNHDQPRIYDIARSTESANAWLAFSAFIRGAFLVHHGTESFEDRQSSLFDREPVAWKGYPNTELTTQLCALKKLPQIQKGSQMFLSASPAVCMARVLDSANTVFGVFDVEGKSTGQQEVRGVADGSFRNLIGEGNIEIVGGFISLENLKYSAAIFECAAHEPLVEMKSKFE